jgi:microcystin-dependent protein
MENEVSFHLPDMRGAFVKGYMAGSQDYGTVGNIGGSDSKILEPKHIPRHKHIYTGAASSEYVFNSFVHLLPQKATPGTVPGPDDTGTSGQLAAFYTSEFGGAGNGSENQPFDIRPVFYVLAFVIRIKN